MHVHAAAAEDDAYADVDIPPLEQPLAPVGTDLSLLPASGMFWPTHHDLTAFCLYEESTRISFLGAADGVVVASTAGGLCVAFPLRAANTVDWSAHDPRVTDRRDMQTRRPLLHSLKPGGVQPAGATPSCARAVSGSSVLATGSGRFPAAADGRSPRRSMMLPPLQIPGAGVGSIPTSKLYSLTVDTHLHGGSPIARVASAMAGSSSGSPSAFAFSEASTTAYSPVSGFRTPAAARPLPLAYDSLLPSGAVLPHVFLNLSPYQVVHSTFMNSEADVPSVITCAGCSDAVLECYVTPLAAIKEGYAAVKRATRRVFATEHFVDPGFIEFNSVNNRALTLGVTQSGEYRYKVWELNTYTELLALRPDFVIDIKFGNGFLVVTYAEEVAARAVFEAGTVLVPVPSEKARSKRRVRALLSPSPRQAAMQAASTFLETMRSLKHAGPPDAAAQAEAAGHAHAGALIAVRLFPLRSPAHCTTIVTPVVPGRMVQLLELFSGRVVLKQQGEALRLIDIVAGTQVVVEHEDMETPSAQVFMYHTNRFLSIYRDRLELRDRDAKLLKELRGEDAAAVEAGLRGCSQTGNNIHVCLDSTAAVMLGHDPRAAVPGVGDAAGAASVPRIPRSEAGSRICALHLDADQEACISTMILREPTLAPPTTVTEALHQRSLTGVSSVRYDDATGMLYTGTCSGLVGVWDASEGAATSSLAAAAVDVVHV